MMTKRRKPRRADIKKKSLKKLTCTKAHHNPKIFLLPGNCNNEEGYSDRIKNSAIVSAGCIISVLQSNSSTVLPSLPRPVDTLMLSASGIASMGFFEVVYHTS
jgi:hypothetical protein